MNRTWTDQQLINAVSESHCISAVIRKLGLRVAGGNYRSVRQQIAKLCIDTTHFKRLQQQRHTNRKVPVEEYLGPNGRPIRSSKLKAKLYDASLLKEECAECGIGPAWNGKPLTLQLDHINGNNQDNRLENLRILCPNCHRQQPTSSGRARYAYSIAEMLPNYCRDCKSPISKCALRCASCAAKNRHNEKIAWPSDDELMAMVWEEPRTSIAKTLGISDVAIAKRCRKNGIPMPPRGYWAKKRNGCDVSYLLPSQLKY